MISPFKASRCPFVPSCSEYGISALKEYGALKGTILSAWRILRCNPFNRAYLDPPSHWAQKLRFEKNLINKKVGI
jgi:uncharacterized protein